MRLAKNTLVFLNRATFQGNEAQAFQEVIMWLNGMLQSPPAQSEPQGKKDAAVEVEGVSSKGQGGL